MRRILWFFKISLLFSCVNLLVFASDDVHISIPFKFDDNVTSYGFILDITNPTQMITLQNSLFSYGMIFMYSVYTFVLEFMTKDKYDKT